MTITWFLVVVYVLGAAWMADVCRKAMRGTYHDNFSRRAAAACVVAISVLCWPAVLAVAVLGGRPR